MTATEPMRQFLQGAGSRAVAFCARIANEVDPDFGTVI